VGELRGHAGRNHSEQSFGSAVELSGSDRAGVAKISEHGQHECGISNRGPRRMRGVIIGHGIAPVGAIGDHSAIRLARQRLESQPILIGYTPVDLRTTASAYGFRLDARERGHSRP
jgi:hypothetical protein